MTRVGVKVLRRRTLNGTIDGHEPGIVVFRVAGDGITFQLAVATVNFGRGYTYAQFQANVDRVLDALQHHDWVALLLQEIDEADSAPEHEIIRRGIIKRWGAAAVDWVQWGTREPIVVIGADKVTHSRKKMTMDQGTNIGAPAGTGPRRFLVSCIAHYHGVRIALANQHPHRYSLKGKAVAAARSRGERITRIVLTALARVCDVVIDGGDFNTEHYPLLQQLDQRVAYRRRYDLIRFIIGKRRP